MPIARTRFWKQRPFRECAQDCPEMIVIPAGSFVMRSPASEQGHVRGEGPMHSVTIAQRFAVSKFDVMFAEWDACVSVGGCPQVEDSGFGRGTRPVVSLSWYQAQQYVAWFSKMTGRPYRLLPRRNGNMRLEVVARRPIFGETRSALGTPIVAVVGASGTTARPRRSDHFGPMRSVSTIWPATCGSGWRIAITRTTTKHPPMVRHGSGATAGAAWFVVVRGATHHCVSDPPPTADTPPTAGSTLSAFDLGERLALEALLLGPQESRGQAFC
jgi:hypothetical protein